MLSLNKITEFVIICHVCVEPALVAAMKTSVDQRNNVYKSWSGQVITDRNNALFDSLTATFAWCSKKSARFSAPYIHTYIHTYIDEYIYTVCMYVCMCRRDIYEALRLRSCDSPYHGIVQALEKFADLKVCGLLAEVADRFVCMYVCYIYMYNVYVCLYVCMYVYMYVVHKLEVYQNYEKGIVV